MTIVKQQELFNGLVENEQVNVINNTLFFLNIFISLLILVDVPTDFDDTPLSKQDIVDHNITSSKVECIELLRLSPTVSNTLLI